MKNECCFSLEPRYEKKRKLKRNFWGGNKIWAFFLEHSEIMHNFAASKHCFDYPVNM